MQVNHFFMLHAALAAAQLSGPGDDGTPSRDNVLTAKAEGGGPAAVTPSSLHTDYSSLNTISNPDTTAKVDPNTAVETPIPNNPPDSEAGLPVGSTGGGSPQFLESNQPAPVPVPVLEPVQSEIAPPEVFAQIPELAASPATETAGIVTSDSPGSTIATTPLVTPNQPTPFASVPVESLTQTPTVTPSPAEATKAAILAVPDSSSQVSVSDIQSPSASISDPNPSSLSSASPSATAVTTETAIPAAPSTTFLSVITSSTTDPALGFIAFATDSSASSSLPSSLTTTPSPAPSSSSLSSTTSTSTTDQPAMASNTAIDAASLQPATTSYPHSSNEYLSSQAKVAIALVSVVGVLAVMAVIGYVLWHMRMRDARLERNRRAALARGVGGAGKGGNGVAQRHKRNLSVEEKMKQTLEREHDVPLDIGKLQAEEHGNPTDGRAVNRFSTIRESSEESEDSQGSGNQQRFYRNNEPLAVMAAPMPLGEDSDGMAMAGQKEVGVGYGLGRSESQESEESHYSEGGQDEFGRSETLEGQRGRYVHERSESLRSQWSAVEGYYGIERLETEVQGQGAESGSAGDAGASAGALVSEETLVKTESNASTSSGRSGETIGKAF